MKEGIDIEIDLKNTSISDIHRTVTSLINQVGLTDFPHNIYFTNTQSFEYQSEKTRLEKNNLKCSTSSHKYKYYISIHGGDVISDAYIYKAIHLLKNNTPAFVCPEYTFQKVSDNPVIATTINTNRPFNQVASTVIDKEKASLSASIPYATTIQNTCTLIKKYPEDFDQFVKNAKKQEPCLNGTLYQPSHFYNNSNTSTKQSNSVALQASLFQDIKTILNKSKVTKHILKHHDNYPANHAYISPAIRSELDHLSELNYDYKGFMSMNFLDVREAIDAKTTALFNIYKPLCSHLLHDQYDYIMVLPWIIAGGVDLFAINYINTIAELNPSQNILIIITNNTRQSVKRDALTLNNNVEILDIPSIITNKEVYQQNILPIVHSLISSLSPRTLHIMASKVGYDCLIKYNDSIRQQGLHVIFSSYNYLVNECNEYIGYTVQELPLAYRPHDIVTTDNNKSKDLWVKKYGFLPDDILVHDQLFDTEQMPVIKPSSNNGLKILWAAHIRPEKNPEILIPIAETLKAKNIQIDCYGAFNPNDWENGTNPLITNLPNLHYRGPYNNFFRDIDLTNYDLFLYTSHADGTPNVILEAGLSGIPIVSSSVGGIPDAIGDYAILVQDSNSVKDFLNAIERTFTNHDHYTQQATALQSQLRKKHSKAHFVKQVQEMLKRSNHV